jgi:hypothetical protein
VGVQHVRSGPFVLCFCSAGPSSAGLAFHRREACSYDVLTSIVEFAIQADICGLSLEGKTGSAIHAVF